MSLYHYELLLHFLCHDTQDSLFFLHVFQVKTLCWVTSNTTATWRWMIWSLLVMIHCRLMLQEMRELNPTEFPWVRFGNLCVVVGWENKYFIPMLQLVIRYTDSYYLCIIYSFTFHRSLGTEIVIWKIKWMWIYTNRAFAIANNITT